MPENGSRPPVTVELATEADRPAIYRFRHQVYATELRQHPENPQELLTDPLDAYNIYIKASIDGRLTGFISITPPDSPSFSVDKYFPRASLFFPFDNGLYEVRLLTVMPDARFRTLALLLMYAAFRWVQSRGGTRIVAIGRVELLRMYHKAGLQGLALQAKAGAVTYELFSETVASLQGTSEVSAKLLQRLLRTTDWRLPIPFAPPSRSAHGGKFFEKIGEDFDHLERAQDVISADVLDAWFPPAPGVLAAIGDHLSFLLQTSPPTDCAGMMRAIARARHLAVDCIVPAAGSSELIFLCFRQWLTRDSRVLLFDPSYSEYDHVCAQIIGCRVDYLRLWREDGYAVDLRDLTERLQQDYDLVVLVNPNSPTGKHVRRIDLEPLLRATSPRSRVWIDETYVDYVGEGESLENFAVHSRNVVVCKSMSKVYALSGARAAYLCAHPEAIAALRSLTPPWAVSLPAQVAAVNALADPGYYAARYQETRALRATLAGQLRSLGIEVIDGAANFLLCHLPEAGPDVATIRRLTELRKLFVRDFGNASLGRHAFRIAVKDGPTNARMVGILKNVLEWEWKGAR